MVEASTLLTLESALRANDSTHIVLTGNAKEDDSSRTTVFTVNGNHVLDLNGHEIYVCYGDSYPYESLKPATLFKITEDASLTIIDSSNGNGSVGIGGYMNFPVEEKFTGAKLLFDVYGHLRIEGGTYSGGRSKKTWARTALDVDNWSAGSWTHSYFDGYVYNIVPGSCILAEEGSSVEITGGHFKAFCRYSPSKEIDRTTFDWDEAALKKTRDTTYVLCALRNATIEIFDGFFESKNGANVLNGLGDYYIHAGKFRTDHYGYMGLENTLNRHFAKKMSNIYYGGEVAEGCSGFLIGQLPDSVKNIHLVTENPDYINSEGECPIEVLLDGDEFTLEDGAISFSDLREICLISFTEQDNHTLEIRPKKEIVGGTMYVNGEPAGIDTHVPWDSFSLYTDGGDSLVKNPLTGNDWRQTGATGISIAETYVTLVALNEETRKQSTVRIPLLGYVQEVVPFRVVDGYTWSDGEMKGQKIVFRDGYIYTMKISIAYRWTGMHNGVHTYEQIIDSDNTALFRVEDPTFLGEVRLYSNGLYTTSTVGWHCATVVPVQDGHFTVESVKLFDSADPSTPLNAAAYPQPGHSYFYRVSVHPSGGYYLDQHINVSVNGYTAQLTYIHYEKATSTLTFDLAPESLPAVETYPVWVNGVQFTNYNYQKGIPCGDGAAYYDPETNTLELRRAAITDSYVYSTSGTGSAAGIYAPGDLNILVDTYDSSIDLMDDIRSYYAGIYVGGALKIYGSAGGTKTLNITVGESEGTGIGIYAAGGLNNSAVLNLDIYAGEGKTSVGISCGLTGNIYNNGSIDVKRTLVGGAAIATLLGTITNTNKGSLHLVSDTQAVGCSGFTAGDLQKVYAGADAAGSVSEVDPAAAVSGFALTVDGATAKQVRVEKYTKIIDEVSFTGLEDACDGYPGGEIETILESGAPEDYSVRFAENRPFWYDENDQPVESGSRLVKGRSYYTYLRFTAADGRKLDWDALTDGGTALVNGKYYEMTGHYVGEWFAIKYEITCGEDFHERTEEPGLLRGDVNLDGTLSIGDVSTLLLWLQQSEYTSEQLLLGDINGDGTLSITDVSALLLLLK